MSWTIIWLRLGIYCLVIVENRRDASRDNFLWKLKFVSFLVFHRNLSEPVVGRVTSNSAEIQAVTRACCQARAARKRWLHIYTDSEFVINCETKWIDRWRRRNWLTLTNRPVVNRQELEEMDHALQGLHAYRFVWSFPYRTFFFW